MFCYIWIRDHKVLSDRVQFTHPKKGYDICGNHKKKEEISKSDS